MGRTLPPFSQRIEQERRAWTLCTRALCKVDEAAFDRLFHGAKLHVQEAGLQRAVKEAASTVGLPKAVSCHALRPSFATPLLEDGYDIRTMQELRGHRDVSTTMIDTHVLNRGGKGVYSPIDRLQA